MSKTRNERRRDRSRLLWLLLLIASLLMILSLLTIHVS